MERLMEREEAQLVEAVCSGVVQDYVRRGVTGIDSDLIAQHVCKAVYGEILHVRVQEIRAIVRQHMQANNAMATAKVLS